MWEIFKFFFRKEAVVAELKNGSLPSSRIKDFLLFILLFTTSIRLFTSTVGALKAADTSPMGRLIPVAVVIAVLVGLYFIFRAMLLSLYRANGGDQGQNFLERLVTLGISASVRVTPACIAAAVLVGLVLYVSIGQFWMVGIVALSFVLLAIGVVAWTFLDIKKGLLELRA